MTTVATEPITGDDVAEFDTGDQIPRPHDGPPSPALSTHGDCAIGEFLEVKDGGSSSPRGADWVDIINPWYLFDFEEAEFALDNGRLVALPCGAEDRAAVEVALTCEIQLAVQTHYDTRAGLLWVRKARRGTVPGATEESVAATV